MGRDRGALYAALASTLLSVLLAIAVNVGTGGALPGPVAALAPLAWPLVGVLTVVTVWLAIRADRAARAAPAPTTAAPAVPAAPHPAELPPADGWTGRADDLDRLHALVAAGRRVIVVAGPPGIGKSALVTRLAHDLAADHADGQLVASLGGGSAIPADPGAVLADLLDRLGAAVPGTTDLIRLSRHWRSTLAGRRVLLVLDDARDAAQVRPLLPGAPGCRTLVTSRSPLADLAGSVTYHLDVLSTVDALDLLREAGAGDRVDVEPAAAVEVITACGALPLALRLAGARLRGRPEWSVAELAALLRDERARLGELTVGDLDVRASFATAYEALPDVDRRAFRRLGAYPGRDLPAGAVAALTGDPGAAERLVDARLLDAGRAGRYRLHDLIRLYARELLEEHRSAADAALRRLVDWYVAVLPDADAAWLDAETGNLALAVRAALDRGAPLEALRLAQAADVPLMWRAEQYAFLGICRDRLAAAEALGDPRARDEALTRLGETANAYGHVEEGIDLLRAAVDRWTGRADADWLARARKGLGVALRDAGRHAEAVTELEAALAHFAAAGDTRREAQTLLDLGVILVIRDEPAQAIAALDRARAVAASARMHPQERVWILLTSATALHQQGRYAQARPLLEEARRGFREPVNSIGEGLVLLELGDAADHAGDPAGAAAHYAAARAAFSRIDHRPGLALAAQAVGHHHARHDRPRDAEAAFAAAAAGYEELGNRPHAGLNLLWRAEQVRALGRGAEADADVARGEALLRGSDLPQAGAVRARLRGDPDAEPRRRPRSA